ncbi:MAG TPA: AraC family transcriptional regulator [Caulobacter sp.]|nr:AraC family transcriptional regulator [Caulobacter sp.]
MAESRSRRLGGESVLSRLSELIFIEIVRRYAERLPTGASGWFGALSDPQVGRALRLLHAEPARAWTLAALARETGLSRSVLAERFTAALGAPPMTYLQNWRMQIASSLLAVGSLTVAQIAMEVGYESEAAFSRAFKRVTGEPPGARRGQGSRRMSARSG